MKCTRCAPSIASNSIEAAGVLPVPDRRELRPVPMQHRVQQLLVEPHQSVRPRRRERQAALQHRLTVEVVDVDQQQPAVEVRRRSKPQTRNCCGRRRGVRHCKLSRTAPIARLPRSTPISARRSRRPARTRPSRDRAAAGTPPRTAAGSASADTPPRSAARRAAAVEARRRSRCGRTRSPSGARRPARRASRPWRRCRCRSRGLDAARDLLRRQHRIGRVTSIAGEDHRTIGRRRQRSFK